MYYQERQERTIQAAMNLGLAFNIVIDGKSP